MISVAVRAVPYLSEYGLNALRDSVIVMYGGFAFVAIALPVDDARRLHRIIDFYRTFTGIFLFACPIVIALAPGKDFSATLPVAGCRWWIFALLICGGEFHSAGIAIFILSGFRRVSPILLAVLLAAIALVATQSRGGMLAILLPIALSLYNPWRRRLI